ncbi:hypothetical protein [Streptomyces chilikensis]|uniref:Transposase n=1 Tax=Streptomyces chilikensis TaxID=1194079 RepID=A0ABV3EQB3_9ACTN
MSSATRCTTRDVLAAEDVAVTQAMARFGGDTARLTRTAAGGVLHRQCADHLLLSPATGTTVVTAVGQGAAGVDLLVFGAVADPVSWTGAVSAAWLAAQGRRAFRLHNALTGRRRRTRSTAKTAVAPVSREETIATAIEAIWRQHTADETRPRAGHRLSRIGIATDGTYWLAGIMTDGRIIAPGLDKHIPAA